MTAAPHRRHSPRRATGGQRPTDSRAIAAAIADDVRSGHHLLDAAFDARVEPLDSRDRRWTQELLYGLNRKRELLDALIDHCARGGIPALDRDLVDLLRMGLYQLLFMDSVPPYAAIGQTVELVKQRHGIGAARLANAVLRRVDRDRAALVESALRSGEDDIARLAVEFSHPRWMIARWVARWGIEETRHLLELNNQEAPTILRPFRISTSELLERLGSSGSRSPVADGSVQLVKGTSLVELEAFREGSCFVQDPAASLVALFCGARPSDVVLDLCAAPGGKSMELASTAQHVIACDRSAPRAARIQENVQRIGATNIEVRVADALTATLPTDCDIVLLDAPCTGTGTFRRHPDARWRLKVSDLAVMAHTQRELLEAASKLVAPGKLLVYSTCSLEPEENDEQVERFLRTHQDFLLDPPPAGAVPAAVLDGSVLRVLPQQHGCDGAFAARFRRAAK